MISVEDLQRLAGVRTAGYGNSMRHTAEGSNISITGTEKARLQRKHNIQPGTDAWFRLWFSRPYLTGEPPLSNRDKRSS
jgi:hypothetical protein